MIMVATVSNLFLVIMIMVATVTNLFLIIMMKLIIFLCKGFIKMVADFGICNTWLTKDTNKEDKII